MTLTLDFRRKQNKLPKQLAIEEGMAKDRTGDVINVKANSLSRFFLNACINYRGICS